MSYRTTTLSATLTLQGSTEQKYQLSPTEITLIGRAPDCQIVLNPDEYITVSRYHIQLQLIEQEGTSHWQVADTGTTNGTIVNGEKIDGPYILKDGDRITLGWKGPEFLFTSYLLNPTVLVAIPDAVPEVKEEKPAPVAPEVKEEKLAPVVPEVKEEKLAPVVPEVKVKTEVKPQPSSPIVSRTDKTLWNLILLRKTSIINHPETTINGIAFSPDGQTLASTGADKLIKLWNLQTSSEVTTLSGHKLAVKALAFSPDGQTLASAGADKLIKLWSLQTNEEVATLSGHKLAVNAIAFSPDGQTLASAGADKLIKLWNLQTSAEQSSFNTNHRLPIHSLVFSPDGQMFISSGEDKTLKLFWAASGEEYLSFSIATSLLTALAISPDGQMLASGGEPEGIQLWTFVD